MISSNSIRAFKFSKSNPPTKRQKKEINAKVIRIEKKSSSFQSPDFYRRFYVPFFFSSSSVFTSLSLFLPSLSRFSFFFSITSLNVLFFSTPAIGKGTPEKYEYIFFSSSVSFPRYHCSFFFFLTTISLLCRISSAKGSNVGYI